MKIDLEEIRARLVERQSLRVERQATLRDRGVTLLEPKRRPRLRELAARILPWRR
jgi:hypothetical protein